MAERFDFKEFREQEVMNRFPSVPQLLIQPYKEFIDSNSDEHNKIKIGCSLGAFTPEELVGHFEADTALGRLVAHDVYLGATRDELIEEGLENPTDEQVLTETIKGFNRATYFLRVEDIK